VRKLLDGDLRLRTACDLEPKDRSAIRATRPEGFELPSLDDLEKSLPAAIEGCAKAMAHRTVSFEGKLEKGKDEPLQVEDENDESGDDEKS
jgi:CRISPR-associated protein Csb1